MKRTVQFIVFIVLLASMVSLSHALSYMWFTDQETTNYGYRIKWWHGDTLEGPIRTNSQFSIMEDPVFYDAVISTASDFWHGSGYNPQFLGPRPVFNAPALLFNQERLNCVRQCAQTQGHLYSQPGKQYQVIFQDSIALITQWDKGTALHVENEWAVMTETWGICLYFDGPVRTQGTLIGRWTLASAEWIGIADNLRYADADSLTGITPQSSFNLLGLVAGGDVKILNTFANGRNNSGGGGRQQTNQDSTSVVITAAIHAPFGSFTFEQQNDLDSGYVCECSPDDRGSLILFGGVEQSRRGYLHRSNRGSTGYTNKLRYDHRLLSWHLPGFCHEPYPQETDTVNFGNVAVGISAWDTARVNSDVPCVIGLPMAGYPFSAAAPTPSYGQNFMIPVRFSPPRVGQFSGYLSVSLPGQFLQIPLIGRGVAAAAPPVVMDIAPNPFNSATLLRYDLTEVAAVRIVVYDLLGRVVQEVHFDQQPAGNHLVRLDGEHWASGVYFATLRVNTQTLTRKMLLLK